MVNGTNRVDVAVFIDFENVYVSVRDKLDANPNFESIMDRCADLGRVVIAKAYADWYRYPRVTSALYANGIEPMYVPTYYYDREMGRTGRAIKNSVDIHICIDAMKTLFTTQNIAKFVLVTGDRDFIPLVNSIRQQGKEVVVIGIGGAASAHLAQSADEFIFYEQLVGAPTTPEPVTELLDDRPRARMPEKERERVAIAEPVAPQPEPDVFDTLVEAIKLARKRNYVSTLGSLKLLMKELMGGDFRENKYRDANGRPFAKFKDFVLEAERRGKVQVFTSGTVNEVFLPSEDPQSLSQFANVLEGEQAPAEVVEEVEAEEVAPAALVPSTQPASRSRRRRRRRSDRRDGDVTTPLEGEESEDLVAEEGAGDEFPDHMQFPPDELLIADEVLPGPAMVADYNGIEVPLMPLPVFDADEPVEMAPEAEVVEAEPEAELVEPEAELVEPEAELVEPEAVEAEWVEGDEPEVPADAQPVVEAVAEPEAEPAEPALEAEPVEALAASGADQPAAPVDEAVATEGGEPSFSDDEWLLFRRLASGFEKAVSYRQIFDALRDMRNDRQIKRTNLELEQLVKQAINSDMFERSGRGARITYRLRSEFRLEDANVGEPAAE